jgi:predicted RNase H-like HicB family nuclease
MNFTMECEQEEDGRWLAEVPELPGVLAYGQSSSDAMSKAEVLALRVIAERLENGECEPVSIRFSFPMSA